MEALIVNPLISQSYEKDLDPISDDVEFAFPPMKLEEFPFESAVLTLDGSVRTSPPLGPRPTVFVQGLEYQSCKSLDRSLGGPPVVRPQAPSEGFRTGREVPGALRRFPVLVPYCCNLRLPSNINLHFQRLGENGQPQISLKNFVAAWMEPMGERMAFEEVYDPILRVDGRIGPTPPADRLHVNIPVGDAPASPFMAEPALSPPMGLANLVSCKTSAECHIRRLSQVCGLFTGRSNSFLQPFLHDVENYHRDFLWHIAQARRLAPPGLLEVADHIMGVADRETRIAGESIFLFCPFLVVDVLFPHGPFSLSFFRWTRLPVLPEPVWTVWFLRRLSSSRRPDPLRPFR